MNPRHFVWFHIVQIVLLCVILALVVDNRMHDREPEKGADPPAEVDVTSAPSTVKKTKPRSVDQPTGAKPAPTATKSTPVKITSDWCLNSDLSKITDQKTAETCFQLVCEPEMAKCNKDGEWCPPTGNEGRCIRFMARSAGIQDF